MAAVRSLQYEELMPENQDLCMELGSIPDTLPNRVEQREDDREHGIRKLSLPSFKFNWLNENRVFGRDSRAFLRSTFHIFSMRSIDVDKARLRKYQASSTSGAIKGFRIHGRSTSTSLS